MEVAAAIENWVDALGGRERLAGLETAYIANTVLVEYSPTAHICGRLETWFNSKGSFRSELNLIGDLHTLSVYNAELNQGWTMGYDDHVVRLIGPSHSRFIPDWAPPDAAFRPREEEDENRQAQLLRQLRTKAYMASYSFAFEDRLPGTIEWADDSTEEAPTLQIAPEGGDPIKVTFDPLTWHPTRMVEETRHGTVTGELDNWTGMNGLFFPFETVQPAIGEQPQRTVTIKEISFNPDLDDDLFLEPAKPPRTVTWPEGVSSVDIPFELVNNNPFIQVTVNDQGPFWFGFDTGSSASIIEDDTARAVGLDVECEFERNVGGGDETSRISMVEGVKLMVGGVEYHNHNMMTLDLDPLAKEEEGRPIEGILGGTFLDEFIFTIDYGENIITLYEPSAYQPEGVGIEVPIDVSSGVPLTDVTIVTNSGEVTGKFMVDTGAHMAIAVNQPFLESHRALDEITPSTPTVVFGVGGDIPMSACRAPGVRLGTPPLALECKDVVIELARASEGSLGSTAYNGFLGGEILRRFAITFDYFRGSMRLTPNEAFTEPYEFDMSGMVIVSDGEEYQYAKVVAVAPGTPASDSGLRIGDWLLDINERPVVEIAHTEIEALFKVPDTLYAISLRRDEVEVKISMTTRRLI